MIGFTEQDKRVQGPGFRKRYKVTGFGVQTRIIYRGLIDAGMICPCEIRPTVVAPFLVVFLNPEP
jgi:hypothetical protein